MRNSSLRVYLFGQEIAQNSLCHINQFLNGRKIETAWYLSNGYNIHPLYHRHQVTET